MEDRGGEHPEKPPPGHIRFVVTFDAEDRDEAWANGLKHFLSEALRRWQLRCVRIETRK